MKDTDEKIKTIAIDLSPIDQNRAGIAHFVTNVVNTLAKLDRENKYYLLTHNKELISHLELTESFEVIEIPASRPSFFWILKAYSKLRELKPDVFISTGNFLFGFLRGDTVQILYDLAPITTPEFWPLRSRFMFRLTLWLATLRSKFVTISHHTKSELNRIFPKTKDRSWFIGTGLNIDELKLDSSTDLVDKSLEIGEERTDISKTNYILSVSTLQPRKNYVNMIRGFAQFLKDNPDSSLQYLIAGKKGWYFEEIFEVVGQLNLEDRVRFLGFVSDAEKARLYENAKGFLYLSFEEGFGIPNLEAYANGVPVLTSDISIFREVMKDNAIFADPNNVEKIGEKISEIINTKIEVDEKFLREFSWEEVGRRLISNY